jgi:phosphatidylinositol 3-kinase
VSETTNSEDLHLKWTNSWNEWITLPIRYCDLPLSSQITFTVWDIAGPRSQVPVGGSTFRLFGKKWCACFCLADIMPIFCRTLRRGKHRLLLWPGREADGSMRSTTSSKMGTRDEMGRLEKVRLVLLYELVDCAYSCWIARKEI